MKKLTKAQISKILDEVSEEVDELLKSEAASVALQKAAPGQETSGEVTPSGSSTDENFSPEGSAAPSHAPDETSLAPGPEGSAPGGGGEEPPPPGPGGEEPALGGDEGGDAATPEALAAEYSQLPLEDLKMHFEACQMALEQALGGAGGAGDEGGAGAPPEASAGPGGPGGPPEEMPGTDMGKSKREIDNLKKSLSDKDGAITNLKGQIGKLTDLLEQSLVQQQVIRKSAKGLSDLTKSSQEPQLTDVSNLSKAEVIQKLRTVTADGKLSKADRELINQFVITPDMPVETVAKFCK